MCCLVSPMYSKEIYKQLELIKEVLALSALMANKDFPSKKIQERLQDICFPEDINIEMEELKKAHHPNYVMRHEK